MAIINRELTEQEKSTFILLPNAPDPEERYLYSRELDLVMNKETGILMDYYWDDMPDGYEIPLDRVLVMEGVDIPADKLGISVFYHNEYKIKIPCSDKTKILKFDGRKEKGTAVYPRLYFRLVKNGKDSILTLHRLTARIYLPNPENKPIANHKGIVKDYNIQWRKEDVCWFTSSENNSKDRKDVDSGVRYIAIDDSGNESSPLSSKDLPSFLNTENSIRVIQSSISNSIRSGYKRYRGYYWKVVNIKIIEYRDYLISSGHLTLEEWENNDEIWQAKEINGIMVEANLNGVVRYKGLRKIDYTYIAGDVCTDFLGIRKSLYQIIALIFSDVYNSFKDVSGLEVDHINSNHYDNRPCNLRFVTHPENMNNPNTIEKRQKKILCYDLFGNYMTSYNSSYEYAQLIGCHVSHVNNNAKLSDDRFQINNCLIFYEDTVKYLPFKLQYVYYKFDKDGNCISASSSLAGLLSMGQVRMTYCSYLNAGITAPDGFYYQQGPDFLKDENGKRRKRIRPIIYWKDRVLPDDFPGDIDLEDEP